MRKFFNLFKSKRAHIEDFIAQGRYMPVIEELKRGEKLLPEEMVAFEALIKNKLEHSQYDIVDALISVNYPLKASNTYTLIDYYTNTRGLELKLYLQKRLEAVGDEVLSTFKWDLMYKIKSGSYSGQSSSVESLMRNTNNRQYIIEQVCQSIRSMEKLSLNPLVVEVFPHSKLNKYLKFIENFREENKDLFMYERPTEIGEFSKNVKAQENLLRKSVEQIDKKVIYKVNPMNAELENRYNRIVSQVDSMEQAEVKYLSQQTLPELRVLYESIAPSAEIEAMMEENLSNIENYLSTFETQSDNVKEFKKVSQYLKHSL